MDIETLVSIIKEQADLIGSELMAYGKCLHIDQHREALSHIVKGSYNPWFGIEIYYGEVSCPMTILFVLFHEYRHFQHIRDQKFWNYYAMHDKLRVLLNKRKKEEIIELFSDKKAMNNYLAIAVRAERNCNAYALDRLLQLKLNPPEYLREALYPVEEIPFYDLIRKAKEGNLTF